MEPFTIRDPHSYGNTHEVVTSNLGLDVTLDFAHRMIVGHRELTLIWVDKAAGYVDLDTNGLTITAVTGTNGQALQYELDAPHPFMGSRLRVYAPTRPSQLRIAYQTHPQAGALQWLTPEQTTSKYLPYLFTQSQAILARTWFPCMDSPGVRVTYDATVRVPPGMTVVMSAQHQQHDADQGLFRFTMPLAIPPYLIALAAGEMAFQPLSGRTGVYAEPAVLEAAAWECADMEQMVQAAEGLYGAYRWGRWDAIILPPSFPFGGMENPMLTFATPTMLAGDRSLISLMAHELAHSWSGNLVTNATWGDFWLNEGCTTYFERRIVEVLYGREVAEMHWLLGQRALQRAVERFADTEPEFTKLCMRLDDRDPDDAYSELPYEKGANFLRVLEMYGGRRAFDTFLQTYFADHAFQSMTTQRFLALLKTQLFQGDTAVWKALQVDAWVYAPGVPDNMVIPPSGRFERTRAAALAFIADGSLPVAQHESWVTAEWLDFLKSLPEVMASEQLRRLDAALHFSESGNAEILFAWLALCIRNTDTPAWPVVEDFLCRQGRRKFLQPLYEALWRNPATQPLGRTIYSKARAGYHPIAIATLDTILQA